LDLDPATDRSIPSVARKFLYLVVILVALAIAALLAYRLYAPQLMRMALVPSVAFEEMPPIKAADYADAGMWIARPDLIGNPAQWTPPGIVAAPPPRAAMFFIHPTSYLDRSRWNATFDDQLARDRAVLFLRGQASAFNDNAEIWAPRYRQATFGAFLTSQLERDQALDLAYGDVSAAFDAFLRGIAPDRPILLAGHSQGSIHLMRLLRERIKGTPLQRRIVATYAIGWPISRTADLPQLGLPECARADQAGCLLAWQSFAEPADPALILQTYDGTTGFNGQPRTGTPMICTNPITGTPNVGAPASANLGTVIPSDDMASGTLAVGKVSARCDTRGFLLIGPPPEGIGQYVLPGNNYHVFDFSLFWSNIRADAARRLASFEKQ